MTETLEQVLSSDKPLTGKPKKYWNLDDIANSEVAYYNRVARADRELDKTASNLNAVDRVVSGTAETIGEMIVKTPEQIKILYGQTQMSIGLKNGDEEKITVGKSLIQTAVRNLDMINANMEKNSLATENDKDSFAYGTGNALASYGSMWFSAGLFGGTAKAIGATSKLAQGVGTTAGIVNMAAQEMGGEVEEGIDIYRQKNPNDQNLENISPEWASKEAITTAAYGAISSIIEKKMGFGLQRKVFLKPMDIAKRAGVGSVSEYSTENLQSLANMGIDLADNSMDWDKLPQRLKDEFIGNLPALLIGAGGGVTMGVEQRAQTKNAIREMIKDTVPAQDLEVIIDNVYDSAIENLSGIVATELAISSELQAKHGAIYDSMMKVVAEAIETSGSENYGNELEKAQYINDVSKRFADEVLAEANFRNTPIDEVLEATDIVFEDGGIKFKNKEQFLSHTLHQDEDIYLQNENSDIESKQGDFEDANTSERTERQQAIDTIRQGFEQAKVYSVRGLETNSTDAPSVDRRRGKDGLRDGLVEQILDVSPEYKEILQGVGFPAPSLLELKNNNSQSATKFFDAINNAKKILGDKGNSVYSYSIEEYQNMKLLLTEDGLSGIAIKPDGDIVSAFSASEEKHRATSLLLAAIQNGGKKLDCFDTFLPKIYANLGFKAVARNSWSDEYSPDNWNKDYYHSFNSGEPDVVYMVYDKNYYGEYKKSDGKLFEGENAYDLAVETQTKEVEGKTYKQAMKGSYQTSERLIRLFETADYSTLSHELGHYWIDSMWTYVRSGKASDSYIKRFDVIADWLNIKPTQMRLTRSQQEKFASGYEAYLTKGDLPSPILKGAFDDYENWLKKVYKDVNSVRYQNGKKQLPVKLSDDAIRFFDSMTTGELSPPIEQVKKTIPKQKTATQSLNDRLKSMKKSDSVKVSKQSVEPRIADIDIDSVGAKNEVSTPTIQASNITDGEKGESRVYSREVSKTLQQQLGDELSDTLEYTKINLEEQSMRALEFVRNDIQTAKKVIDGGRAPDGILDTAIRIAYENEMLRIGNNIEYMRALKLHSAIQTARGQEIAAERLATNDMLQPKYWLSKVLSSREFKAVNGLFDGKREKYLEAIKKETRDAVKDLLGLDLEAQVDYLAGLSENLKEKYRIDDVLYQSPLDEELKQETATLYVRNFIEETFGIAINEDESALVINKAEQLAKSFENSLDQNGNPNIESFQILSEMNKTVESLAPSHAVTVISSILGRSNMLASVKSPVLNIISNVENFITEAVVRRISSKKTEMAVDKEAIKNYKKWTWDVYKASGFIPSQMMNISDEITTLGETRPTTQGKSKLRQVSQTMENIVFKYLMGAPDAVAKDYTFVDVADLEATDIAMSEGLTGDILSKRATEIFQDSILIQPQTEEGLKVREKAVEEAHVTTYTNDSFISDWALKGREWLNGLGTGKLRAGDIVMPFVKTPANVAMLGLEYGLGGLYTAYKIPDILKNPRSSQAQRAIKAAYRNGLGTILALLLASLVDPEDYIPEFDNATSKDRDLAKAKNAPFNSIKIGDKYISLDYFGPLAIPLVGILNTKKSEGAKDIITNYIKGTVTQAAKIPGIKEVMSIGESIDRIAKQSTTPEKFLEQVSGDIINQVRARLVPAIIGDIAKMTDSKERDTSEGIFAKVKSSIPGLRNTLPERYNIEGRTLESENPLNVLLFGSRVKTATSGSVIDEISRLASKKEQPSISDVTRYGELRYLSPSEKIRVRQEYAKEFARQIRKETSSSTYKKKDDEDKKKSINKLRRNIVKDIKSKYSKNIEQGMRESK